SRLSPTRRCQEERFSPNRKVSESLAKALFPLNAYAPFLFKSIERLPVNLLVVVRLVQAAKRWQAIGLYLKPHERSRWDVSGLFVRYTAQRAGRPHTVQ